MRCAFEGLLVIVLTAHTIEDDRIRCLDASMDDYLSNPVKLSALAAKLEIWARPTPDAIATPGTRRGSTLSMDEAAADS